MSNWCHNVLTVRGDGRKVHEFVRCTRGKHPIYADLDEEERENDGRVRPLAFNALVPVPKNILKQGYSEAGYRWQNANWGTKWEPDDISVSVLETTAIYEFDTPWTPPIQWLQAVAKIFPDLTFVLKYSELGMHIEGEVKVANGEQVCHIHEGDAMVLKPQYWEEKLAG